MRILFLSSWFPWPTNNGSKLRIYHLLRGLAARHEVTLLSFADQPDVDPEAPELRSICREVHIVPWKPYNPHGVRAWAGLFSMTPRSIVDTFSPEMARQIRRTVTAQAFDLVIASQCGMMGYSDSFRGVPALSEEVEVGVPYGQFAQATSALGRLRHGLTWAKYRTYLDRRLRHFRACTVVSEQERHMLFRAVPRYGAVEVIPNCVNLPDYAHVPSVMQPDGLIFTGSFRYSANHDAMGWFLQDIYPRIRAQVPEVRLTITGDHADRPLPPVDGVTLTGFVDDVRPLIAAARVTVVPIRRGGGTRLKILEAMALRTPVVTTSKGAEGLNVSHGEHLLIADTPGAFSEAVISLLRDAEFRDRLADRAYQRVREQYDWATAMPRFLDLVDRVAHGQNNGTEPGSSSEWRR
jgi:glycosyltransferase involved in cell wall biosynthesis